MRSTAPASPDHVAPSAFAPLKNPIFRSLWLSTQVSGLGWLVQTVAVSWLMASISRSDVMVALVQASSTLPAFILSIIAGAIADSFSHRIVMLVGRCVIVVAFAILSVLIAMAIVTPWIILGLTFLAGCGIALTSPAWQASVSDIVDREDVPAAVVLISAGFNTIRSVGPALGGILVASFGPLIALIFATLGNLVPLWVLWRRKWVVQRSPFPREQLTTAVYDGLRFTLMSSSLKAAILRGTLLGMAGIAVLALLPLLVRDQIEGGAATYGILMAGFGTGALSVGMFHHKLGRTFSHEQLILIACLACAACSLCLALTSSVPLAVAALAVGGAGWVTAWSELGVSVQLASPRWVVGRSLSIYYALTYGGIAVGSWIWGLAAEHLSLAGALGGSAVALALVAVIGIVLPIERADRADLDPVERFVVPELADDLKPRSGPIVVRIDYSISPDKLGEFLFLMPGRRRSMARAGARYWNLQRDLQDPERWIEIFRTPTWTDYLRLNHRLTATDKQLSDNLAILHLGDAPPQTSLTIERSPSAAPKAKLPRIFDWHL